MLSSPLRSFLDELHKELDWDYLTEREQENEAASFTYVRTGFWCCVLVLPVLVYLTTIGDFGQTSDGYVVTYLILFVYGSCTIIGLILSYGDTRLHILMAYFIYYAGTFYTWWHTLTFVDLTNVDDNYYTFLQFHALSYIILLVGYAYFPILVLTGWFVHAVAVVIMAFWLDPTAKDQIEAFLVFLSTWVAIAVFWTTVRKSFLLLGESVEQGQEREKKLLNTQSLLDIALVETRLGLIGFDQSGNCLLRKGAVIKNLFQDEDESPEPTLGKFLFQLNKIPGIDSRILYNCPQKFEMGGRHFLMSATRGTEITVFSFLDITERQKWDEKIRAAQKMSLIGELASGVAHDYNNILAIALSNVEAFPAERHPALYHEYVAPTLNALSHAKSVSQKLLILAGQGEQNVELVDVSEALENARDIFGTAIGDEVELKLIVARKSYVSIDVEELKAAVLNLVINAKHALQNCDRPMVVVQVDNLPETVRIRVEDNGVGFSDEDIKRLFDPFFTTKKGNYSTGLGLSMVRGFVQQSGGTVRAERVRNMTRFTMEFPRISADKLPQAMPKKASAPASSQPAAPRKILLVDDNRELAVSLQRLMNLRGVDCKIATNIETVDEILRETKDFEVVVLDYSMPEMTGLKLGSKLMEEMPDARYFILTGGAISGIQEEAQKLGFQGVINKPIKVNDLLAQVFVEDEWLARHAV